jgi:hypothetical protein
MGLLKNITGIVDKSVEIIDQAVLDKDKANELKTDLVKSVATLMLTGKGASITKYTICGLTILVVGIGAWTYLFRPAQMMAYKDFALFAGPLIMGLGGYYLTGTSLQDKNGRK